VTNSSKHRPVASVRTVLVVAASLALVAGACSSSGGDEDTATDVPVTVEEGAGAIGEGGGLIGLVSACPPAEPVEDPAADEVVETAVGVDDPDIDGLGDPALADLGNPKIDVTNYDLALTIDPEGDRIDAAVARLDVTAVEDIDEVALDFVGLDIASVAVGGETVDATRADGKLVVPLGETLAAGEGTAIDVCYSGVPKTIATAAIFGAQTGWSGASGGSFVLSEPEAARTWFPANEHPTDKATFTFTVTVPVGYVGLANGKLTAAPFACTGTLPEGPDDGTSEPCVPAGSEPPTEGRAKDTFRWEMPDPMAPYLAVVLVGDYRRLVQPDVDGVPVEMWLPAESRPNDEKLFARQSEMLEFLVGKLGPFPFENYGGAVLPGPADDAFLDTVAFEAQSMSIYGADAVIDEVLIHETAHQWVGDSVTLERWARDLWWVEGFATFAQWLWVEETEGAEEYAKQVQNAQFQILGEVDPLTDLEPTALFSPLAYDGGALVFHSLRRELGDELFFEFLRTFTRTYAHANASTADLMATANEVAGRDLSAFFSAWLDNTSRPTPPP